MTAPPPSRARAARRSSSVRSSSHAATWATSAARRPSRSSPPRGAIATPSTRAPADSTRAPLIRFHSPSLIGFDTPTAISGVDAYRRPPQ
eukprot:5473971-Prymnesium_polylepis.1